MLSLSLSVASIRCSRTKRHDYAVLRLTSAAQAGEALALTLLIKGLRAAGSLLSAQYIIGNINMLLR